MGHAADVAAGEIDDRSAEAAGQFGRGVAAGVSAGLVPGGRDDPVGVGTERLQVEAGGGVLAQLVLEPVDGVGAQMVAGVPLRRAGHGHAVAGQQPYGRGLEGHERTDDGGMAYEGVECDGGAEDRGRAAEGSGQAPEVVGVGLQAVVGVLPSVAIFRTTSAARTASAVPVHGESAAAAPSRPACRPRMRSTPSARSRV